MRHRSLSYAIRYKDVVGKPFRLNLQTDRVEYYLQELWNVKKLPVEHELRVAQGQGDTLQIKHTVLSQGHGSGVLQALWKVLVFEFQEYASQT